jgi:hypothetical protein
MPAEPPPMTTMSPLMVWPQCWSVMVYRLFCQCTQGSLPDGVTPSFL